MASASFSVIAPSFFLTATSSTVVARPPPPSSSSCASPSKLHHQDLKPFIPSQLRFLPNQRNGASSPFHFQPNPNPVLIDVQDRLDDSVLFSFGIAEQCTRHEQILRFLMSGSASPSGLDLTQLCHLLGFHPCRPLTPQDHLLLVASHAPNTITNANTMQLQMHMPEDQACPLGSLGGSVAASLGGNAAA